VVGLGLLVVVSVAGVRLGAVTLSWHEFWHAFFHYTGTDDDLIVRDLRLPEVLVAVEVGAALAVAGGLMQGLTRNPLADPGILGINAGASLFVVLAIALLGLEVPSQFEWFALPGAAFGTALSLVLAMVGRGRPTPLKLTLAGVINGSILGAATAMVVFLSPSISESYQLWGAGDVDGRSMSVVYATAPIIVVGLLVAIPLGQALNGLTLGEEMARALGQRVGRTRALASLAAVLLAGGAVAAAGPVAFVGLAAPTAVRRLVGNDYRWVLPLAGVYGAVFVVAVDLASRYLFRPEQIPTGIAISVIGAPMFIYLVSRRRLVRL
jgi:iron complex transport system permease protein